MALDAASKAMLQHFGIDPEALTKAITTTGEQSFKFTPKSGEIKVGDTTYHLYDNDGHEGLKGRVKSEVLTQAEEIGIKAIKKAANLEFEGKDPAKFIEALSAKLNISTDEKVKEKERDIITMRTNWETEKKQREEIAARLKDREDFDRDLQYFPDNRIKTVKDKTLRLELKEDGITFGEHEAEINGVKQMVPAVFKNGVVQKNADLSLIEPKVFASEHFKAKGWIVDAQNTNNNNTKTRTTFDTNNNNKNSKPKFDHQTTYDGLMQKYGGWTDKAQAEYTQSMVVANS